MAVERFSLAEYTGAIAALLPPGRAFVVQPGSDLHNLVEAYAQSPLRLDRGGQTLLVETFPATTDQLLTEWESSVGLPDKFDGANPSALRRRQQMLSRFTGNSCLRAIDIVNMAAILGYDVGCMVFNPAYADEAVADAPLYDEDWVFAVAIVSSQTTYTEALADISHADEALAYWGNGVLEGAMREALPAWYVPVFVYVDGNPLVSDLGYCFLDDDGNPITV